jgi:hypothetical protein
VSLLTERLFRLSELSRLIPPGPTGRARHFTPVYRYATRGIRGLQLEAVRCDVASEVSSDTQTERQS